jgi:hypothetical protein
MHRYCVRAERVENEHRIPRIRLARESEPRVAEDNTRPDAAS